MWFKGVPSDLLHLLQSLQYLRDRATDCSLVERKLLLQFFYESVPNVADLFTTN